MKFEFTDPEVNLLGKALALLPYYEAIQVVPSFQDQIVKARQPQPEVKNEE